MLTGIAKRAYDVIMAQPTDEAAALMASMIVHAGLQYDLENHQEMIQKRVDEIVDGRISKMKQGLLNTAVSKRIDGQEIYSVQAAAEIIKAFDYTKEQRRAYVRRQQRGPGGRFRTMTHHIDYSTTNKGPMPGRVAQDMGIPHPGDLGNKARARYQQAYMQVSELVDQFSLHPDAGNAFLKLTYKPQGDETRPQTVYSNLDMANALDAEKFANGGRLQTVEVVTDNGVSVGGAAWDVVGALGGGPYAASRAAAGLQQNENGTFTSVANLKGFERDWNEALDQYNPGNRVFTRMSSSARLLDETLGDRAPKKVQLALRTANYVGQHAPEAQKVIGPTVDRAAYRYRGVEKPPDPRTIAQINAIQATKKGEARNALIYGWREPLARKPGQAPRMEQRDSPLIRYFQGKLPSSELMELQRQSGVIPPSQGMVLDKRGKVVTEAVGYGDDWYLPFNLKNLGRLRGGEYVRTRAWGGPTTEDIYAGLMAGAKAVTVVSHNGTYTIEFDESFRGTRRYNDKAARMVKRYGHLLDAVQSKQVTLNKIPEARTKELEIEAAGEFDPRYDKIKYNDRLKELKTNEREKPQMAAADKRQTAEDFLTLKAQDQDLDSWEALASQHVERQVGNARTQHTGFTQQLGLDMPFDESGARGTAAIGVSTPEKLIEARGWQEDYAKYLATAEADYRNAHSPLDLDGVGYKRSMDALQEQFPYYIKKVSWQEKKRGGYDYGYVKPKFNRPSGANAGYFDRSITGFGKLPADATRYQNTPHGQNLSLRTREERPKTTEPGGVATTSSSDISTAMREQNDVLALHKDARKPTIQFEGKQVDALNSPTAATQLKSMMPWVYGRSPEEVARAYANNPQEAKEGILKDLAFAKERGYGSYDSALEEKVRDPAGAARGHKWNALEAVGNPSRDYDFGTMYGPGRTAEQYEATIADLASRMGAQGTASDEELKTYIKDEASIVRGHGEIGNRHKNEAREPHLKNIENAVRLMQLRRRRQLAAQQAVNTQHANRPDVTVVPVDQGSLDDAVRRHVQGLAEQGYNPGDEKRPPIAGELG